MEELSKFIDRTLSVADKRNLSKENPITLLIDVNGVDFYVVVSHLEPNHVTLPLNVTWIVADPESPKYKKALRRVSALPFNNYRNTWAELQSYQDFVDEAQFWDFTATFQLGEVEQTATGPATESNLGYFRLNMDPPDPSNPKVVSSNDPRMSDARVPLDHGHPLLPSTMLQGSQGINEFFVTINGGGSPEVGQILVLTGTGDENNEWLGIWRDPVESDIEYDGPTFDQLIINGPQNDETNEGAPAPLTADAVFSDGTTQESVGATWEIIAGQSSGTINTRTGVFTPNDVTGNQTVRIRATWTDDKSSTTQSATYELTIVDTTVVVNLTSVTLNGPTSINEGETTASYNLTANYDDGSSQGVTPDSLTTSNSAAGSLDPSTGTFTSADNVDNDQSTTITATYSENGVTKSDSIDLTVVDTTVYPDTAVIKGPDSIDENTNATYKLEVTFTDLTTSEVVVSDWQLADNSAGSIDSTTGQLTAATDIQGDIRTSVSASYTSKGTTVNATKNITVADTDVYPLSAVISGPDTVDEDTIASYQMSVDFSDGTTQVVNAVNWTSSNTSVGTFNTDNGEFTAATDITSNGDTTISASFSQSGTTVNGSKTITVIDTTVYPNSAEIVGDNQMEEGTSKNVTFRVTYTDGSTSDVVPNWSSSNTGTASIDSSGKITTAVNLQSNSTTEISGSYTESGTTVNASMTLTVKDVTNYPQSAAITGPTSVPENTTATYQLEVTYQDGTTSVEPVSTFTIDNASIGTLTSTGDFTAVANTDTDLNAVISADFTLDGTTVSATKNLTVTDETVYPQSAQIIGPDSIDENTTQTYTLEVTFTDASVSTQSVTDWASSDTSVATINSNTGLVSAIDIVGDKTTTLSASFTSESTTVNASKQITVVDKTVYPDTGTILGPSSVTTGGTEQYEFEVTFTDGTTQKVSASDWAVDNSSMGVINASTGEFQASSTITQDETGNITVSYTSEGTTVTGSMSVTVNFVVPNAGMPRWAVVREAGPNLDQNGFNGPQDFIDSALTNIMPSDTSGEEFTYTLPDDTSFAYFAYPKSLGTATFLDVAAGFSGGWDGASWPYQSGFESLTGPITVQYDDGTGVKDWYVYRTDFPGPFNGDMKTFRVSYTNN